MAQPRDAGRVEAGEDLAAWRALQQTAPEDPEALVAFLEEFPSSPLAELAYRKLVEVNARPETDLRGHVGRIASSYNHHEVALNRSTAGVAVATLEVESTASSALTVDPAAPTERGVELGGRLEAGFGYTAAPGFYLGAGVSAGGLTLAARAAVSEPTMSYGLALRVSPWRYWTAAPFAEATAELPDYVVGGALGASWRVRQGVALEAAAGARQSLMDEAPGALVRVGVAQTF